MHPPQYFHSSSLNISQWYARKAHQGFTQCGSNVKQETLNFELMAHLLYPPLSSDPSKVFLGSFQPLVFDWHKPLFHLWTSCLLYMFCIVY